MVSIATRISRRQRERAASVATATVAGATPTGVAVAAPVPALPSARVAAAFGLGAVVLATLLPLGTWTVALAGAGLWHVLAELRYVRARFGPAFVGSIAAAVVGGLAAIVALRLTLLTASFETLAGPLATLPFASTRLELALVCALALVGAVWARRLGRAPALAAGFGALTVVGLWSWPVPTVLLLAALHNLTPLGFLAEALPAAQRRRGLLLGAALLIGLPLLVATGLPWRLAATLGLGWPELSPMATEGLGWAISTALPADWLGPDAEMHAFAGLLVAQLLHYGAVIEVLPHLANAVGTPQAPLPRWQAIALAAAIGGLFALFVWDFRAGRSVYGLFAAIHAWLEVPLLLAWLAPRRAERLVALGLR